MLDTEILTVGVVMAPSGTEGSFSLSGIPPEAVDAIAELALERGKTLKELYTEIALDFLDAVKAGESPTLISTYRGSTRKTVWVDPEVGQQIDELCKSIGRTRSSVMLTAIQRFLIKNGQGTKF